MKRLFLFLLPLFLFFSIFASDVHAISELKESSPQNVGKYLCGSIKDSDALPNMITDPGAGFTNYTAGCIALGITGIQDSNGVQLKSGILPIGGKYISMLFENQPSSREYIADILDNVGIPTVSSAYAQGTGYTAMQPFLPIWKVFRNLAYSLYIIIFIVIGVMIMLRTKVNAQTIITIQSALPNLLITLILITFSYAIVGFMIDLMYFLIYFVVYLISAAGLIDTPTKAIARLMNYSAWSVLFEGRNSILSAVSLAIGDVLSGLGTGALEAAGTVLSWVSFPYLIASVYLALQMLRLMLALVKSYVMLLVQLITAPVQILFNAMPGSKAFSTWLKTTASYLVPFPVAAAMFIFAAVLIGDPTQSTILKEWGGDANPFGVSSTPLTSSDKIWLPPFTLTGSVDFTSHDILVLIGFFIFTMTPSAVKMAQEWMQVKESPYASEAIGGFTGFMTAPLKGGYGMIARRKQLEEQRSIYEKAVGGAQQGAPTRTT